MTRLLLGLLLGLLTACGSGPAPRPPLAQEQADAADRDARRALSEGQLLRAQNGFVRALSLQQSLDDTTRAATTMINLATVDHRLGDDTAALALLDRVLQEQAPLYPPASQLEAAFRKSVILTDLARLEEAETALQSAEARCEQRCPQQVGLQVLRARVSLLKGDAEVALAQARSAGDGGGASKEEQANAMRIVAAAEEMLGQHEAALEHFKTALKMDKALGRSARIGEDLSGMARTAEKLGKIEEAAEYARRAALVKEAQRQTVPVDR